MSKRSAETLEFEVVPFPWLAGALALFHGLVIAPPLMLALPYWARLSWLLAALLGAVVSRRRWKETYGCVPPARVARSAEGNWSWRCEGVGRSCTIDSWCFLPGCTVLALRPAEQRPRAIIVTDTLHGPDTHRALCRVLRLVR